MARLIDADRMKTTIIVDGNNNRMVPELYKWIDAQETVDAEPIVHGHWKEDRSEIVCSVCGARYNDEMLFMWEHWEESRYAGLENCPHCRAVMDGGDISEPGIYSSSDG